MPPGEVAGQQEQRLPAYSLAKESRFGGGCVDAAFVGFGDGQEQL